MAAWQRDLERLLCLVGVGPEDHVFFPTAHGRELVATQRLLGRLPAAAAPTFHLEFRHTFDFGGDGSFQHPYTIAHRVYFDHVRRQPPHPSIHLYTDTDELTEEYRESSGLDFATLPIPFRTDLVAHRPAGRPSGPLTIAFVGDVRDEKGFHWLPDLVEAMAEELAAGKVRFAIQASLVYPRYNPRSVVALERMKVLAGEQVTLLGLAGPLSPREYYDFVAGADLLLCPYDPEAYVRRSSGTLTEAVAAGIPTVVRAGTWLARQQPPGTGEACRDLPSFIQAVRRICEEYPRYHGAAKAARTRWLSIHTPVNLVRMLLNAGPKRAGRVGESCAA
jgi:glycosyltransferase involved in cell wall biosynthesis